MSFDPQNFIRTQCPKLCYILNLKAQRNLPKGLIDFLSGDGAGIGQMHLRNAESRIAYLFRRLSKKEVGDRYRRDLSGVDTESKLAELFCEISLVAALSNLSSKVIVIRPKNNSGTSCDVKVNLVDVNVYGDAKRLEDKWLTEPTRKSKRSIAKSPVGVKKPDGERPRSMEIYSKLEDAYRQFPQGTVNIIFLFHPSLGESISYIRQALFRDGTFFQNEDMIPLENDGLFAIEEWRKISGCAYTMIDQNGALSIKQLWQNPRAATPIPKYVHEKLKELS